MNLKEKFDAGYEFKNLDGTTAVQVIKKKTETNNPYIIEWSDGVIVDYNDGHEDGFFTCTPPKTKVKTYYIILDNGSAYINCFSDLAARNEIIHEITTEQQPDGTWKIIKDTDTPHLNV